MIRTAILTTVKISITTMQSNKARRHLQCTVTAHQLSSTTRLISRHTSRQWAQGTTVCQHRHHPGSNTSRTLLLCKAWSANTARLNTRLHQAWDLAVDRTKNTRPRLHMHGATTTLPTACLTATCLRLPCGRQSREHCPAGTAWPTFTTTRRHDLIRCQKKFLVLAALCRRTQATTIRVVSLVSARLPRLAHSRRLPHVRSHLPLHVRSRPLLPMPHHHTLRDKREAHMVSSSLCERLSRQTVARSLPRGHTPALDQPRKGRCRLANLSLLDLHQQTLSSLLVEERPSVLTAMTRSGQTMAAHHPVMARMDP